LLVGVVPFSLNGVSEVSCELKYANRGIDNINGSAEVSCDYRCVIVNVNVRLLRSMSLILDLFGFSSWSGMMVV
jgi:hypothetical protein